MIVYFNIYFIKVLQELDVVYYWYLFLDMKLLNEEGS